MTCAVCGAPADGRWCSDYCRRRERGAIEARWTAVGLGLVGVLVGCAAQLHRFLAGPPDLRAPSGPVVYLQGHPPDGVVEAIERTHAAAVRACPPARLQALEGTWRTAEVQFMPDPFDCEGRMVHGCANLTMPAALVGSIAVIPDELGHVALWSCRGETGETNLPDGGVVYGQALTDLVRASQPPAVAP